jgi:hypothetical protein
MLDFVFFDPRPRDLFAQFLEMRGVALTLSADDETFEVAIPEDTDEALLLEIERYYDEMMALNQSLFEAGNASAGPHSAGVVLNLADGQTVYAQVDPVLLGRIMEVLTPQEFGSVVNAIVDAVEHPDPRPLCERDGGLAGR